MNPLPPACFEAAGLYFVCVLLCFARIGYLRWKKSRNTFEVVG